MIDQMFLLEACGWCGAMLILSAYALVSFRRISTRSPLYQLMNATGSAAMMCVSYHKGVWQSVTVNIIWIAIACISLVRIASNKDHHG